MQNPTKIVKYLSLVNILAYGNSFLFAYMNNSMTIKGPLAMWYISPFLFLTLASLILANDYRPEYNVFRKEALADYIVRVISFIVAFSSYKPVFMSLPYILKFAILVGLFIINRWLEVRMLRKAEIAPKLDAPTPEVSEADKRQIRHIGRASRLGITSFLIYAMFVLNVQTLVGLSVAYIAVSSGAFIVFVHMTHTKIRLFYKDKEVANRVLLREVVYTSISFSINILLAFKVFSFGEIDPFFGMVVGLICIYPSIRINRKIALRYKEIQSVLGDELLRYYNIDDEENIRR